MASKRKKASKRAPKKAKAQSPAPIVTRRRVPEWLRKLRGLDMQERRAERGKAVANA